MTYDPELEAFINSPNTFDFVVRRSKAFDDYTASRPYIRLGAILTGDYQIVYMPREMVSQSRKELGSDLANGYSYLLTTQSRQSLEASGIINLHDQPYLNLRGNGVLIGFVDTGIDYTLPAFQYEDGSSRIRYIWDQTIEGDPPNMFLVGSEYNSEKITEALRTEDPFTVVPHRDTSGHGTFLASVAASRTNDEYIGAAPDSELIVVKMRKAHEFYLEDNLIPPDVEDVFESSALMVGIEYIYKKAQELEMPVVICIGLGTNMGGHAGFSLLSEYLSGLSYRTGVCVCTAAGNESLAQHHTQGIVQNGDTTDVEVKVGEKGGNVLLDIWNLPSDRISVSVKSPVGEIVHRIPARSDTSYDTKLVLEKASVTVEYYFPVESGGQLTRVKIADATPGIWVVTLYGDIILDGSFHIWMPITGLGSPGVVFLTPVPNGTIVTPGTTIGVITCGAYNNFTGSLYPESSWGPSRLPEMAPDLVAPGDTVSGIYPNNQKGTMSGTGASTAITAGASALMMQWGIVNKHDISLNTYKIKAYFIRGCIRDQNIPYPNFQWGYGKLNLYNTFLQLL